MPLKQLGNRTEPETANGVSLGGLKIKKIVKKVTLLLQNPKAG